MLLQTLATLVILVLFAGGLLTSSLVAAKAALHETVTRQMQLSLARGTDDFDLWAARYVYANHANATWPSATQYSQPLAVCPTGVGANPCGMTETTSYRVTGSTSAPTPKAGAPNDATAANLQTAVDEQRISAELTVTVTDGAGATLGSATRELTLRVFDTPPWAIVTGSRDLSSVLGATSASEGDTAGVHENAGNALPAQASPDPLHPWRFQNTVIFVTMACVNSSRNNDQSNPYLDNNAPGDDGLPWGLQSRAYEAPCAPEYAFDAAHDAPPDSDEDLNGNYAVGAFASPKPWLNGSNSGEP